MDLHRLHVLTPQVRGKEGLGRCVAIDEDRVIADRTGQDVGDRTEDRERILPKKEGRAYVWIDLLFLFFRFFPR